MIGIMSRRIVIYCSSHGLGHLTRCLEVARVLRQMGHRVTFVTSLKNCEKLGCSMTTSLLIDDGFSFIVRDRILDSGAIQQNVFSVDVVATLESYKRIDEIASKLYIQERDWLIETMTNLVVSDAVPIAFRAAEMANIPSVCLSNFTWDYIYRAFGCRELQCYDNMISHIEEDCSKASLYLRLPGSCACSTNLDLLAIDIPMVVRLHRQDPSRVRESLGIPHSAKICLVMLGGHEIGIDDFSLDNLSLPKDWICLVTPSISGENDITHENIRTIPHHAYIPDYVACVNAVIGKIGYGAVSECIAHQTPLIYVRRKNFAEESSLIELLKQHKAGFEISLQTFLSGNWHSFLRQANLLEPSKAQIDGAIVASKMIVDIVDIHETLKQKNTLLGKMHDVFTNASLSYWTFVKQLLVSIHEKKTMNRTDTIYVCKAPGRLDVMGGIADYSGSYALEMSLSAGTIVATQCCRSNYHNEGSNNRIMVNLFSPSNQKDRTTSISIDLSDILMIKSDGSAQPKDFKDVQGFFKRNAGDSWSAYIVGAFPVIAHMKNLLIGKDVKSITIVIGNAGLKEGAGVSSSASLEVASILSIAAALNIELEKYEAPKIAQMVENHIVGACCGIMDQLTSFLGRQNKFISLHCTDPFKFNGYIDIPPNIKFWGIDSGVKRSTSSSSYTECRVAAFMGKKIINQLKASASKVHYLADIEPADFETTFEQFIPNTMTGAQFLATYGAHEDITTINPSKTYKVRDCTRHPIRENDRIKKFTRALKMCDGEMSESECRKLGSLMYDSHESYSRCGLGSVETDLLVQLAKETREVFGAKITGGGGGGTVCFLTFNDCSGECAIKRIQELYESLTCISATIYHGSASGADAFGVAKVTLSSLRPTTT